MIAELRQRSRLSGPKGAFIYALVSMGEVVYIGQTWNIEERLGSHQSTPKVWQFAVFVRIPEKDGEVERFLIYYLEPSYNHLPMTKAILGPNAEIVGMEILQAFERSGVRCLQSSKSPSA